MPPSSNHSSMGSHGHLAGGSPVSTDSDTSAQPRWLGKRVGRFRLISLIGKGAYGRVFLGEDVDLHRRVALKVLTADATVKSARAAGETMDSDALKEAARHAVDRMIREARAAAAIEHPNVVQIYEVGRIDGTGLGGFIAMELLEGGTLHDLVRAAGPMDVARACSLVADAADALQFAHEMGVVHRDVKPANLMLSRPGRCKVADFGLAWVDDPQEGGHHMPIAGTAHYMAPEVIYGSLPDPRSDQYSLAATTYMLLTGRPPFGGSDRRQVLEAHLSAPVPDLLALRPDLDPRLGEVIARAMAKDPGDRFPSIRKFGTALRLFTVSVGAGVVAPGIAIPMAEDPGHSGTASASMSASSLSGSFGVPRRADPLQQLAAQRAPAKHPAPAATTTPSIWLWVALAGVPLVLLTIVVLVMLSNGRKADEAAVAEAASPVRSASSAAAATPPVADPPPVIAPEAGVEPADSSPPAADPTVFESFQQNAAHFAGFPHETVRGSLTHLPAVGTDGAVRLEWTFSDASTTSEAAYLRLERPLGESARRLEVRVRAAEGRPPARVLLKAALKDKAGERALLTLHDGALPTEWTTYGVEVPSELTPPLEWQDVYVVRIGTDYSASGAMEVDSLHVRRAEE